MVRSEIISKLSSRIDQKLKKSDLEKILKIFLNTIVEGIKDNKSTELRNFGRFSVKTIKEKRNARNPSTGEKIHVEARKSISFKMSKELREKINKNRITN
jgi:integration host factor subunit beta|tara:strand:+ start:478 stop:777 length:300 start_codon:yes stop_codon:yes gene_type:complete